MKRMKRWFACLVLLLGIACLTPNGAEAANWVWVTSTDYATVSIDASSVRKSGVAIYFWDQWKYIESEELDEYIAFLTNDRRKRGDEQTDFSDLRLVKYRFYAYRSRGGSVYDKILALYFYDSRGKLIFRVETPESKAKWGTLSPGSIGEKEFETAYAYAK